MTGFGGLHIAEEGGEDTTQHWSGTARILGPRWARFATLSIGLIGLQVFWSVEMSYASPYLLSLGLTKSHMALVFLAGPLSGLIVQPLVGILADNSKSRFGRRRPYMICGSAFCIIAMLLLGYTREFADIFSVRNTSFNDAATVWLAVLSIYCMDFAINAVQAVDRALIVDTLSGPEQASGNAWAAQMLGIGGVLGFFVGNVDLTGVFGWIGGTQLKILSVISSFLLIGTHLTTASLVKEKVLVSSSKTPKGMRHEMMLIWSNIRTLPPVIRQICIIQFFAWIGWFPTLFYTTTYIGDLYKRASPLPASDEAAQLLDAAATRLGTQALFFQALVSLSTNFLAPMFVLGAAARPARPERGVAGGFWEVKRASALERFRLPKMHLATLWALSHGLFALCMEATFFVESVWAATLIMMVIGISWAVTLWAPMSLISEAILSSVPDADDTSSIRLTDARRSGAGEREQLFAASDDEDEDEDGDADSDAPPRRPVLGSRRSTSVTGTPAIFANGAARQSRADGFGLADDIAPESPQVPAAGGLAAKAGIILGIHNIFVVVPQFLVTALSSIIFAIFEPDKSVLHGQHPGKTLPPANTTVPSPPANATVPAGLGLDATAVARAVLLRAADAVAEEEVRDDGVNSVAVIFRIGGVAAIVACVLTWRLARELKRAY